MDKFNFLDYLERKYEFKEEDVRAGKWNNAGLYFYEVNEMVDLIHLFYTNREKYEKEIHRRATTNR
jgi:hypothetical protein